MKKLNQMDSIQNSHLGIENKSYEVKLPYLNNVKYYI